MEAVGELAVGNALSQVAKQPRKPFGLKQFKLNIKSETIKTATIVAGVLGISAWLVLYYLQQKKMDAYMKRMEPLISSVKTLQFDVSELKQKTVTATTIATPATTVVASSPPPPQPLTPVVSPAATVNPEIDRGSDEASSSTSTAPPPSTRTVIEEWERPGML